MTLKVMEHYEFKVDILLFDSDYYLNLDGTIVSIFDELEQGLMTKKTVKAIKDVANCEWL